MSELWAGDADGRMMMMMSARFWWPRRSFLAYSLSDVIWINLLIGILLIALVLVGYSYERAIWPDSPARLFLHWAFPRLFA